LKLFAGASTLATVSAVYVSADAAFRPHPLWLVLMGAGLVLFAGGVCVRALSVPALRGVGLVLGCVALAGAGHLGARWLLVDGDAKVAMRMFATARVVATAAFLAEVAAVVLALAWFATGVPKGDESPKHRLEQSHWLWPIGAVLIALATALVFAQGDEGWRLLLSRTLAALGTHPDPLVPALALNLVDLLVLGILAGSVLPWARSAPQRAAIGLVLVGRASFDVPLAGLLVLAGLLTVLVELPLPKPVVRTRESQFGSRAEARR
jgi:hypothetical protein